jgi:hypothetical protein
MNAYSSPRSLNIMDIKNHELEKCLTDESTSNYDEIIVIKSISDVIFSLRCPLANNYQVLNWKYATHVPTIIIMAEVMASGL